MDRRMTKSLEGKCGSCRYFTVEQGRECCGFCSGRMKRKGRLYRTYKCIGYEAAPTIIPASEEHTMEEFMYGQEGNPNDGSM